MALATRRWVNGRIEELDKNAPPRRLEMAQRPGFRVIGSRVLYKTILLREYDEDGLIVAPGDETDPLPTGHTLDWTIDWIRAHA
jgi:hypothetical protein